MDIINRREALRQKFPVELARWEQGLCPACGRAFRPGEIIFMSVPRLLLYERSGLCAGCQDKALPAIQRIEGVGPLEVVRRAIRETHLLREGQT